jgi:hypothetical protein
MHVETSAVAGLDDRPVDPWTLLTGGSITIVAGLSADLLRLGVHQARRLLAGRSARRHGETCDWQRPCTSSR